MEAWFAEHGYGDPRRELREEYESLLAARADKLMQKLREADAAPLLWEGDQA